MSSICYNLYRMIRRLNLPILYSFIPKIPYFIFLNGFLNINECFISFGNLSGIWIESSLNPYRNLVGVVYLASVA